MERQFQNDQDFSAIVRADLKDDDIQENSLRPQLLSDFLGQESVKKIFTPLFRRQNKDRNLSTTCF